MYYNLRPVIQDAYQHRLQSGNTTSGQGRYLSCNAFAGLTQNNDEEINNKTTGMVETIAATINLHFSNLSGKTAASLDANATQVNASLQQLASNNIQLHQQQQAMMQQMALLMNTPWPTCGTARNTGQQPPSQIYAPPAHNLRPTSFTAELPQGTILEHRRRTRRWQMGCGGGNGRRRGNRTRITAGGPPVVYPPFARQNAGKILYIPAGFQPNQQHPTTPCFGNIVKQFANQNVCLTHGFDVEEWHTSATCRDRKLGHQEGFNPLTYMEYSHTNHNYCKKAMHERMYPQNF